MGPKPTLIDRDTCWASGSMTGSNIARYPGLRPWIKYIGEKIPSRPASAIAAPQRFNVSATLADPFGAILNVSSTFRVLWVTQRQYCG